ncbi:radical SAM protein [Thermosipho ferrireducens]|uniref:Radical SAM protein n=1 Tax=Thermosipho ferrireducens TaxID=2571116 RepID=A0ABX7S8C0_9BACT|nr:radical SAM protein [Thermosipho ferrireducens]QTA38831.1 radical SAM protein [Thermosipho ferrireducens]
MRRPRRSEDFKEFSYVQKFSSSEIRFLKFSGNREVALIFPSTYRVAASSLAWSWVQQLLVQNDVAVERFFYEKWFKKFYSIETQTPLDEFRILMFSFQFELDFFNIIDTLLKLGIPPLWYNRNENHPTIIIGGPVTLFNPDIVKPIADIIYVGDLENNVSQFSEGIKILLRNKKEGIKHLSKFPYILSHVNEKNTLQPKKEILNFDIQKKVPISHFITPYSEFPNKVLIEIGRGCIRRCAFCVTGYTKKPVKFVKPEFLEELIKKYKYPIGIISATITDYPWIDKLLNILEKYKVTFSVSSMRADKVNIKLLELLKKGGQNSFTIAPEGISEKLRQVMLKDLQESEILNALELGRQIGFKNVKAYYIIGLQEETPEDFLELKSFIKKVKKLGYKKITLSVNPLIPKKCTPFSERKLIDRKSYTRKIKWLKENLKAVKIISESYKSAELQYTLNNFNEKEAENFVENYIRTK